MDIASVIGVVIGLAVIVIVGYESSEGHIAMFVSVEGLLTVGVGSISVMFMAMPMQKLKCVPGYMKAFLFTKGKQSSEVVRLISSLGDKARKDGLLALEPEIQSLQTSLPFLASGLRMVLDGVSREDIEGSLRMEILAMQDRHKSGKKFFDLLKLYGPGWGLVGTLIGQIGMFGKLGGDIEVMGHMLALAVCATMYGTVLANAIAGPIGDKLAIRSGEEILNREMILQGLLSIQNGDNPRITFDKMLAFLPMPTREKLRAAA